VGSGAIGARLGKPVVSIRFGGYCWYSPSRRQNDFDEAIYTCCEGLGADSVFLPSSAVCSE